MHLSAVFIRRPIMASLLMAAFILAGLFGYSNLPVSELPNVDFPTIDVNAGLPGADAETMASSCRNVDDGRPKSILEIDRKVAVDVERSACAARTPDILRFLQGPYRKRPRRREPKLWASRLEVPSIFSPRWQEQH